MGKLYEIINLFYEIKRKIILMQEMGFLDPNEERTLELELNELRLYSKEKIIEMEIEYKDGEIRSSVYLQNILSLKIELNLKKSKDNIIYNREEI
jgi:hypothetical protein